MNTNMLNHTLGKPQRATLYCNLLRIFEADIDPDRFLSENAVKLALAEALSLGADGSLFDFAQVVALSHAIASQRFIQTQLKGIRGPVHYDYKSLRSGCPDNGSCRLALGMAGVWYDVKSGEWIDGEAAENFVVDLSMLKLDNIINDGLAA